MNRHLRPPDADTLLEQAGGRSFACGVEYAEEGLVTELTADADAAHAVVRGTAPYRVSLRVRG